MIIYYKSNNILSLWLNNYIKGNINKKEEIWLKKRKKKRVII